MIRRYMAIAAIFLVAGCSTTKAKLDPNLSPIGYAKEVKYGEVIGFDVFVTKLNESVEETEKGKVFTASYCHDQSLDGGADSERETTAKNFRFYCEKNGGSFVAENGGYLCERNGSIFFYFRLSKKVYSQCGLGFSYVTMLVYQPLQSANPLEVWREGERLYGIKPKIAVEAIARYNKEQQEDISRKLDALRNDWLNRKVREMKKRGTLVCMLRDNGMREIVVGRVEEFSGDKVKIKHVTDLSLDGMQFNNGRWGEFWRKVYSDKWWPCNDPDPAIQRFAPVDLFLHNTFGSPLLSTKLQKM